MNAPWWLLALTAVSALGLGCSSRKSNCEQAKRVWAADARGQIAALKKIGALKVGAEELSEKETTVREAGYIELCLKRSDVEVECLTKAPPHVAGVEWKMDPACESVVDKMERDLSSVVVAPVTAGAEVPRPSKTRSDVNIGTLDWATVPRWTWSLQKSANVAGMNDYASDEDCPEAKALEDKPAADEFEKKERKAEVAKLRSGCVERIKKSAEKLPPLAVISVTAYRGGEFDFDKNEFPLLLPGASSYDDVAKKARAPVERLSMNQVWSTKFINGALVLNTWGTGGDDGTGVVVLPSVDASLVHVLNDSTNTQVADIFNLKVESATKAKELRTKLEGGIAIEFLFEPDPSTGPGIHSWTRSYLGLQGRPLGYRVLLKDKSVLGPFKLGDM